MGAFEQALMVEAEHIHKVVAYLKSKKQLNSIAYLPKGKEIQHMFGDLIVNTVKNEFLSAEVKIDQVGWKSNNFFLETWSNKNYTQGWMKTCKADYLIYYFTILEEMYIMKFNMLKHWAYELKEMDKFKTKEQKKYNQLNVSVGHVVPIWKLGNMKWCTKIDLKQDDLCGEETIIFK